MEENMLTSPQTVYDNLNQLEQVDIVTSARYRQQAQEVLANPEVSFSWREAIADRLNQANQSLTTFTVSKNDSY